MKKAFTLIELVAVLTIISLLMQLTRNQISNYRAEADSQSLIEYARIVEKALAMYYYNTGNLSKILSNLPGSPTDVTTVINDISDGTDINLNDYFPKQFKDYTFPENMKVQIMGSPTNLGIVFVFPTSNEKLKSKCKSKLLKDCEATQVDVQAAYILYYLIKNGVYYL